MTKINWKTLPNWAMYIAMDADGEWYCYEYKPRRDMVKWFASIGNVEKIEKTHWWKETLRMKPST